MLRGVVLRYYKRRVLRFQPKKRQRKHYSRMDYRNSVWWHFINKPTVKDPSHRDGKLFRLRFRVPFNVFDKLLFLCREGPLKDHFLQRDTDVAGRAAVPIELKLLGVLRVLGRGSCFDSVAELTGTDDEVHRVFFHKFIGVFVSELFHVYVCPPKSRETILQVLLFDLASSTDSV